MVSALPYSSSLSYRPEIDGLRAIAVLSVIFYHAGFSALPYGFLGVDIFFVISGYLITSILLNDLSTQQFSLMHFYERRARRILPALTAVLIATVVLAWFWLLPHELKRYGDSLFSTSLFHSNLYFAKESGYFAPTSQVLPLLHTWSLAVEEQFYFVFPILLYLAYRFGKMLGFGLLVLGLIGSYAYFLLFAFKSDAIYFLPYTRAWELMLGVLCAIGLQHKPAPEPSIKQDILPLLGLVLLGTAMTVKLKYSSYNLGMLTMQACVGTAMLIYCCRVNGLIKLILSAKWLVAIGLISYSAYLIHNPILAFSHVKFNYQDGSGYGYLIIAISLLLAWLSYRYVEQPFRKKTMFSRQQIFILALVSIIGLAGLGLVFSKNEGFADRSAMQQIKHYSELRNQRGWGEKYCEQHSISSPLGPVVCVIGNTKQKPVGVLWGDSLAGSLLYGMHQELDKKNVAFYAVISNACPPIEGLHHHNYDCTPDRHHRVVNHLITNKTLKNVVWIGNFIGAMNNSGTPIRIGNYSTTPRLVQKSMSKTLKKLSENDKKVILVVTPPIMPLSVPEFYMRKKIEHQKGELAISFNAYQQFVAPLQPVITSAQPSVSVLKTEAFFCDKNYCYARNSKDELLYMDTNHFSQKKSMQIAKKIVKEHLNL